MSSKNRGSAAASKRAARRAPQHSKDAGRHREPSRTVSELTAGPATVGVKLAAVGVLGSAAALAVPTLASAASVSQAGSAPVPEGPQPPSGVVVTPCVGGGCITAGVYSNGARVFGLGVGTPSVEIAPQYGPPPSQSSVGAAFSVDSPFGGRGKLIFDSAKGISWQASASANSGGFTVGQTYAPGQGLVWDNTLPSSNYRIGLRDNVMVYYKYVPPQTDWTQPAQTGDGTVSYPPGYPLPPAPPLKNWNTAFGPEEGGPPVDVPPVAPTAPASADPAPAGPASAAPAADTPPGQLNDWSTAFGPSEGGPPLNLPPVASAAPASADPAPAVPAVPAVDPASAASAAPAVDPASAAPAAPAVDPAPVALAVPASVDPAPVANPFAGLAPVAPVYNPVIDTGVGGFSSMGLGTGIDPLSGLSTGISSPLNTGIGTNLNAGLTSSVPGVPSMPSMAPIDNPVIDTGVGSLSSMDLGMSSDPMGGGGGSSGGAAS